MNPYCERHIFRAADVAALRHACKVVEALPDSAPGGDLLRCHEVARVVRRSLSECRVGLYRVVDGKYGAVDHSWLEGPPGSRVDDKFPHLLLDPYVPGRAPACQLIDLAVPGVECAYRGQRPRKDIDEALVDRLFADLPVWLREEQ